MRSARLLPWELRGDLRRVLARAAGGASSWRSGGSPWSRSRCRGAHGSLCTLSSREGGWNTPPAVLCLACANVLSSFVDAARGGAAPRRTWGDSVRRGGGVRAATCCRCVASSVKGAPPRGVVLGGWRLQQSGSALSSDDTIWIIHDNFH